MSSIVLEGKGLFDSNVTPVRNFEISDSVGDGDEGFVVLEVEVDPGSREGGNISVRTIGHDTLFVVGWCLFSKVLNGR